MGESAEEIPSLRLAANYKLLTLSRLVGQLSLYYLNVN